VALEASLIQPRFHLTLMTNTNQVHPIEFFLACIINLVEFIAWTINELAGHHRNTATATTKTAAIATTQAQPIRPLKEDWLDYVSQLTVKQLRQLTGIKNSRINKAHLIEAAVAYC